jgi:hypothetical protein
MRRPECSVAGSSELVRRAAAPYRRWIAVLCQRGRTRAFLDDAVPDTGLAGASLATTSQLLSSPLGRHVTDAAGLTSQPESSPRGPANQHEAHWVVGRSFVQCGEIDRLPALDIEPCCVRYAAACEGTGIASSVVDAVAPAGLSWPRLDRNDVRPTSLGRPGAATSLGGALNGIERPACAWS